jgi:hypothetical protein
MAEAFDTQSPELSRRDAALVRRDGINYPLFVPETGRRLEEYIKRGAVDELLDVLAQLAAAGSERAAALQVYLATIWDVGADHESLPASRERCLAGAQRGDAYSMYVTAWVCRTEHRNVDATQWMRKAATRHGFLPAFVEVGRFAASGVGFKAPDLAAAYSILRSAHKLGHRLAMPYMAVCLVLGAKGWLGRPLGALLWLPAILRSYFYWRRHPLSERVFVTPLKPAQPLFKARTYNNETRR